MEYRKTQLRAPILQKRDQLSTAALTKSAHAIAQLVDSTQVLKQYFDDASHILSYAAFKGEVSPAPLLEGLGAEIYLPKIINYDEGLMDFYPANQPQIKNRYNILEPRGDGLAMPIPDFNIVLVPLVAFDQHGNRLGMGGGFYDRAFSKLDKKLKDQSKKPLLIGLAHRFQELIPLTPDSWDIPLDVILSDEKIIDPTGLLSC